MGRAPGSGGAPAFRFTAREVSEMEKALEANKGSTPARSVVQHLSDSFSASADRAGQKPIQWKQVWNWFQNRRHSQKAKIARSPDKVKAVTATAPEPSHPKRVATTSAAVPSAGAGRRGNDAQMEFEAKSARDGAWYDVSTFISHRLATTGDPEVRVRFAGFGSEEDEWVNVRTAVRQRSLPCEASECVAVLPGDLILCFQEGNEQALYYDADILDVQRRRHDVRGCRCRFWVRYRHDQAEEVVPLRKVCRRPETEYRLLKLQSYGKNPSAEAMQNAAPKPEDAPGALVNDVAGTVPANDSEAVAQASATPTPASTTSAQAATGTEAVPSSSAPETDPPSDAAALSAVPAVMVVTSSSVPIIPEQNLPTLTPHVVEETKGAVEKSGQQVVEISVPSMQAEPEMYDQSESIVVLDRVDLDGSRSNV